MTKDRVISTVGPEARLRTQDAGRGFDGYKVHIATDPNTEIITAATVTPGNGSDGSVACDLIAVLLGDTDDDPNDHEGGGSANDEVVDVVVLNDDASDTETSDTDTVCGDSAYGAGEFQSHLEGEGIESKCKSQKPIARIGFFAKDR